MRIFLALFALAFVQNVHSSEYTDENCFRMEENTLANYQCSGTDVVIPPTINGVAVKIIGVGSFSKLTSVVIPEGVLVIQGYSFTFNNLTEVEIPNSVQKIGTHAFYSNNISHLTIPDSVTVLGGNAFKLNSLKKVELPRQLKDRATSVFDDEVEFIFRD